MNRFVWPIEGMLFVLFVSVFQHPFELPHSQYSRFLSPPRALVRKLMVRRLGSHCRVKVCERCVLITCGF